MIIAFGRGFRLTELKKPPSDKRYGIMPVQSIKSASFTPCTLRSCSTVNEGEGERERETRSRCLRENVHECLYIISQYWKWERRRRRRRGRDVRKNKWDARHLFAVYEACRDNERAFHRSKRNCDRGSIIYEKGIISLVGKRRERKSHPRIAGIGSQILFVSSRLIVEKSCLDRATRRRNPIKFAVKRIINAPHA